MFVSFGFLKVSLSYGFDNLEKSSNMRTSGHNTKKLCYHQEINKMHLS